MATVSGGAAVEKLLSQIKPDERIAEVRRDLQTASGAKRDALHREFKYLSTLRQNNLTPSEAFIVRKLPVVPAAIRPVYADPEGTLISSDLNELYRDVGAVNEQLRAASGLPEKHKSDLRRDLYQGVAAVQGLGDPISDNTELKGLFRLLSGTNSPKGGHFQAKTIRSRQNVSGRSTIALGNDLHVDQVGMPEEMAWTLYRDFAVREMVALGYTKARALAALRERTTAARQALETAMNKRPVWLNRSPSLHRHSILALDPVITDGRAIRINPLITKGFNADFDGDTMSVHVPVSQEAVEEMKGKKPSDVLFAAGQDKLMMVPSQSAALGLFLLSDPKHGTPKPYRQLEQVQKDLDAGTLNPEDPILFQGKRTSAGRLQINAFLPESLADRYETLNKKGLSTLLTEVARTSPKQYGRIVHELRKLGDTHATTRGFSIGLDDLQPTRELRDRHLRVAARHTRPGDHKSFARAYGAAAEKIEADLVDSFEHGLRDNTIGTMMRAGSRGSPAQARQIFAAPVVAQDPQGAVVPVPIENSYADGLDTAEYFSASFGARAGAVGRSYQTSLPGALAKEVLASVTDAVIAQPKGDNMPSLTLGTDDPSDVLGRFTARPVADKKGRTVVKKDQVITPQALAEIRKRGVEHVEVYTPLGATLEGGGLPAMAYGVDETGALPEVGTNVGILSGHAMTEPISQMTLDAFHSGATGGTRGRISKFDRIRQLFGLPENLPDKATLARSDGTVNQVQPSPVGGWDVTVGTQKHYVSPANELNVKPGQHVKQGDRLSSGPIKPQDLAVLRGIDEAQQYLVEEIKKETGVNRRAAEVVVGSMTDHARVVSADPLDDLVPGDVVPNWKLQHRVRTKRVAPVEGVGRPMLEAVGGLTPGHTLTEQDAATLAKKGVEEVNVQLKHPTGDPIMRGVNMLPLLKAENDWMAGMGFRRIKEVLGEGALRGRSSNIHSYNPVPALAVGSEFGLGEAGRY